MRSFQEVGQWELTTLWYQDEHYGVLKQMWECSDIVPEGLRVANILRVVKREMGEKRSDHVWIALPSSYYGSHR